ncbi:MAG TPA: hypothetical protein DD646_06585 [Acidimicrobiaceae bacterium]|nr:hypothetical protein [Acidimicrobiaceae bacterium]
MKLLQQTKQLASFEHSISGNLQHLSRLPALTAKNSCPQSSKFFPFGDFLRNPLRSTEGSNSQLKYQNKLIVSPDLVEAAVLVKQSRQRTKMSTHVNHFALNSKPESADIRCSLKLFVYGGSDLSGVT